MSGPADASAPARTRNLSAGSTRVVQISWNAFLLSRFLRTTRAGLSTPGNRRDSENVRFIFIASAVVSHSPYIDAKPREYSTRFVSSSITSNQYLPRSVVSIDFAG